LPCAFFVQRLFFVFNMMQLMPTYIDKKIWIN
jgi:hypothetical protein